MTETMPRSEDRCQTALGWSFSLLVHGLMVAAAIVLSGRGPLHPPADPFRWNVALVPSTVQDRPASQADPARTHSAPSRPSHAVRATAQPARSQTTPADSALNQEVPPSVEQPVHRMIQQHRDTVTAQTPIHHTPSATTVSPSVIRQASMPIVHRGEGVVHQTAAAESARAHSIERPTVQTQEGTGPQGPSSPLPAQAIARTIVSRTAAISSAPLTERGPDYVWLADLLWTRVQTLKRYPAQAGASRPEGEVLLSAVVRTDGSIAEIRVLASSGSPLLDQAAVETVRSAAPLALLRPLDHTQVSIEIPIAYHHD